MTFCFGWVLISAVFADDIVGGGGVGNHYGLAIRFVVACLQCFTTRPYDDMDSKAIDVPRQLDEGD